MTHDEIERLPTPRTTKMVSASGAFVEHRAVWLCENLERQLAAATQALKGLIERDLMYFKGFVWHGHTLADVQIARETLSALKQMEEGNG